MSQVALTLSAESIETLNRVDTVQWVANVAMITYGRYVQILSDERVCQQVFPGVSTENPGITHAFGSDSPHLSPRRPKLLRRQIRNCFGLIRLYLRLP